MKVLLQSIVLFLFCLIVAPPVEAGILRGGWRVIKKVGQVGWKVLY